MRRVQTAQEAVYGAECLAVIGTEGKVGETSKKFEIIKPNFVHRKHYTEQHNRYLLMNQMILEYTKVVERNEKMFIE